MMTPQNNRQNATEQQRPLRCAFPKKGRLNTAFAAVLADAGLRIVKENPRHDFGTLRAQNLDDIAIEVLTMRGTDALRVLAAGAADMVVVGRDMLAEFNAAAQNTLADCLVEPLPLAACALYIAAPRDLRVEDACDLEGKRIATSFPALTQAWLAARGVNATMVPCDGGVEDMVRLGLADAVCDLVETGTTLAANGLQAVLKVMDSGAVMVTRPESKDALRALRRRIAAAAQPAPVLAVPA